VDINQTMMWWIIVIGVGILFTGAIVMAINDEHKHDHNSGVSGPWDDDQRQQTIDNNDRVTNDVDDDGDNDATIATWPSSLRRLSTYVGASGLLNLKGKISERYIFDLR
jgi:hypothetical protein